ncbi:DUF302 domain-containing protein [uncultured Tateyamaria sp.]|uniref:DUF302 domain-containing protein n=1 Tax=uncultured Tateyamaria sp. TaxID=455651 RepID=UPI0026233B0D|nr:DUF302 domain-containing protein [uncultured Tateyamaria sp.]
MALMTSVFLAGTAMAGDNGIIRKEAAGSVVETMDKLQAALEGAGLTIFARVDHGAGAQGVGEDIGASQLLIFGNPKLGTQAMLDDRTAALFLPMKVAVYENESGATVIAYEAPAEMLGQLGGIATDAAYVQTMTGALGKFTDGAAQ